MTYFVEKCYVKLDKKEKNKLIRKDNILIFIVIIVLIIGTIVLLMNNRIKWDDKNESINNEININTEYTQDVDNIVNPYTEILEDGQVENNSPELKEEKKFKQIEITDINFIYNPGNEMTTITASLKNIGTEEQVQEVVTLKILGQNGEGLTEIEALIPNIKVGETKNLRCSATADLSNASNFEIVEK